MNSQYNHFMNLSIERYQILKSAKKKNIKTYIIKTKKEFRSVEQNYYKINRYNKFFMNSNITNNSKLFNKNLRNYENVLKRNKVYINKHKKKKLLFLPENLDFCLKKNCIYYSKKRLYENNSLEDYRENNKIISDNNCNNKIISYNHYSDNNKIIRDNNNNSNNKICSDNNISNNNINIINNCNRYLPSSDNSSKFNIEIKRKNCLLRNINNKETNNSYIENKKYYNTTKFENDNLNSDVAMHELSIDDKLDKKEKKKKKKKKKRFNNKTNYDSNCTSNNLSRKEVKSKNPDNNFLLEVNDICSNTKMKSFLKMNNKKTDEILLNNQNYDSINSSNEIYCTNKDNSSKNVNKIIIHNNYDNILENSNNNNSNSNNKLVKNNVHFSLFKEEKEEYKDQKNVKSKENLKKNIFEIFSKYNLICDINKDYNRIEKKKKKKILNSENFTDSEIEKYMISKKEINANKNILGDFYINKYKRDSFYLSKDNTTSNFKNIIIKNLGFKKRIVNSLRYKDYSSEKLNENESEHVNENKNLNEKLKDDFLESTNMFRHLDKNIYASTSRNIKISSKFSKYENVLNEKKGCYNATLKNVINNFNLCIDHSSLSTCSLKDIDKKKNNKVVHKNENIIKLEKKNSEKNEDYKNIYPLNKIIMDKSTISDYNTNIINMRENSVEDKEEIKKKEKLKKYTNLKRNLENNLKYNTNKKMRNMEYSLMNINIYKNNASDIYKHNSYNTYILKTLGNSYLKNKLNEKNAKIVDDNIPKISTDNLYSKDSHLHKEDIFNYQNKKLIKNEIEYLKSTIIKNEMDKKLDSKKIIMNSNEENNNLNQEKYKCDKYYETNVDTYEDDKENLKCLKINNLINTNKNSFENMHLNNIDNKISHNVNYFHFFKNKNVDFFDLDLRDMVQLLENEKIENLYSEEELKNILIPINGVYYDTDKKNWICKYSDIENMNYDELNKYFLLKEQNNVDHTKKKIFSTKSCSYHESRKLALEFKYNHVKQKYNILRNISEEENIFFKSTNKYTENNKDTKIINVKNCEREENHESWECKEKKCKKNEMKKEEEIKKEGCYDEKAKNYNFSNSTNKYMNDINEIKLNKTLKILKDEVSHKLFTSLPNFYVNKDESVKKIKNEINNNDCATALNNISNSVITNRNDYNNIMVCNDTFRIINEKYKKSDSYNKNKNYIYEDDKLYINFKTKKNLYKLLGVNWPNDIKEKMKNLYKENIFYEKEEKKWVIKVYEKKNNILLYFKEFDCRAYGFLYACYLSIEHKRLYLDFFLNEKNHNFLIKLAYRNRIKSKMYNTIIHPIHLNEDCNYSLKDINEYKNKLQVRNEVKESLKHTGKENEFLEKESLKPICIENECLEKDIIEKNNAETVNSEAVYVKTDFEKENFILYNGSNTHSEKLNDYGNKSSKKLEKDNIFNDEKNNIINNFENTKNQNSNKLNDITCYMEENFKERFSKNLNFDIKSDKNIKCIEHNHNYENEKKQVKIESNSEKGEKKETKKKIEQKEDQERKEQCNKAKEDKESYTDKKKEENYNFTMDNSITLSLNVNSNNSENENNRSNMGSINFYKNYAKEDNKISNNEMKNIHEKNEKKKKKKKPSFYKKTKTVKDPLVNIKNSNLTTDLIQEERNNLIKLDSYVDILSQKSDITSLAKQTILLLLKDILNCIPFQMAPSITSKKIYDQKIHAHIKFVYQSKNLFDLMPYFFIFKNIIKQKTLPSNQSLYICNVLLYALFEA